jgi:hypothetical protein
MTSRPIDPFFEAGTPPPVLPLLTCQTDLSHFKIHNPSATIIALEELLPSATGKSKHRMSNRPTSHARSPSPYTKPSTKAKRVKVALPPSTTPSDDDTQSEHSPMILSELTSVPSESSIELNDDSELIPKPAGEPGRPHSGGYNLELALGWKPVTFQKLQVFRCSD